MSKKANETAELLGGPYVGMRVRWAPTFNWEGMIVAVGVSHFLADWNHTINGDTSHGVRHCLSMFNVEVIPLPEGDG